jgi:hypothetical protein
LGEGKSGKSTSAVSKIDTLFKAINAAANAAASGGDASDGNGTASEVSDISLPVPVPVPVPIPLPLPVPVPLPLHPAPNQVADITVEEKEEITKAGIGALDQA